MTFARCGISSLALLVAMAPALPARALVGPSADGSALAPFVVMVLNRAGRTAGFCTGVVVARDAVLTAAHCAPPGADLRVHYRDEGDAPVLLPVAEAVRHPGYRADAVRTRERSIDLALIRLAAPLPDRFRPATIATEPRPAAVGGAYEIAGFGVTREGEGASSGHLRTQRLAARAPLSSLLLWARDPNGAGAGACTGDSGGPVLDVADGAVVAVNLWSAGGGAARCGALTQALWLSPHKAWIDGVLAGWAGTR